MLWISIYQREVHVSLNLCLIVYYEQRNGKFISWTHPQELVNKSRQSSRLSLLKKITKEHLQLDSYSRMRMNLAAQVGILLAAFSNHFIAVFFSKVLSKSVSNAFWYYNVDETTETEKLQILRLS